MAGTLFVVATPIGNLEDLTLRGIRVLGEAAVIACEDTRQTVKILNRHGIKKPLLSYFQPKEGRRIPEIMGHLLSGRNVALVSDAGTPGISDPGFKLIREALKASVAVVPIPGPSAAVAALSVSGLPTHKFLFLGFPPPKREAFRKLLATRREDDATLIFYVPSRKILDFIDTAVEILGDRNAALAREITKIHEEFLRGRLGELKEAVDRRRLRGEIVFLIEGFSPRNSRKNLKG
ncbi:MAG: 16S rRNA (cytidine(1402)-2'-O)-methyltransferase [Candidatus Aminicenantes bacterium RBG_13_59_9]|nr:MAG: 16S rRNA (cytidine(1402)-2'-O)-methyltransferase [Candidatus Aminicenantes bacterium RBG_13_59_9]